MVQRWTTEPQYSHGYLIPVFAAALLWLRRDRIHVDALRPNVWGLPVLAAGLGLGLVGNHFYYDWFEDISLLPCLLGIVLVVGGFPLLRWAWPAVAFLFFMIPLPFRAETALQYPLQRAGTVASVYAMQTLGLPATAEGNIISVGHEQIGVAEACSGLRMLMVFFALAVAVAILSRRPMWERLIVVASAVPIALLSNVVRITATATLLAANHAEWADYVFHELGGLLMMPLALGLFAAEMWFLGRLIVVEQERPMMLTMSSVDVDAHKARSGGVKGDRDAFVAAR